MKTMKPFVKAFVWVIRSKKGFVPTQIIPIFASVKIQLAQSFW
jgi:hypothetical protein